MGKPKMTTETIRSEITGGVWRNKVRLGDIPQPDSSMTVLESTKMAMQVIAIEKLVDDARKEKVRIPESGDRADAEAAPARSRHLSRNARPPPRRHRGGQAMKDRGP